MQPELQNIKLALFHCFAAHKAIIATAHFNVRKLVMLHMGTVHSIA
jgi:hypothetical protein